MLLHSFNVHQINKTTKKICELFHKRYMRKFEQHKNSGCNYTHHIFSLIVFGTYYNKNSKKALTFYYFFGTTTHYNLPIYGFIFYLKTKKNTRRVEYTTHTRDIYSIWH